MLNEDYAEMIRKYMRNELNPAERQLFDQIRDTPEFKSQLEQFTLLQDLSRIEALREEAQSLIAEVLETDARGQSQKHFIKVVVVSNHDLFRDGLVELINRFPNCIVLWGAENGQVLTQKIVSEATPDIVLLDASMPLMNGYETALWLREYNPSIKVLAMFMYDDARTILDMYKAGVRGVVLKTAGSLELQTAIYSVMSKGAYSSEMVAATFLESTRSSEKPSTEEIAPLQLSKREIEVLRLVAQGYSSAEIAEQLFISAGTVNTYRKNLCRKLGVRNSIGLVKFALRMGLE